MNAHFSAPDPSMLKEVLGGLNQTQKRLPSKYFYDERGSTIFERITRLEEYYITRVEKQVLTHNIEEITGYIGPEAVLVELGSGSSNKTKLLLDKLTTLKAYIPVDISKDFLLKVAQKLKKGYPELSVIPVIADYTSQFDLPEFGSDYKKQVIFFPGSTIGNFDPGRAQTFLSSIASLTDDSAGMLVGVDLKKDRQVLEEAYNDRRGITACFNKNLLVRLNRELNANFELDQFTHDARYNEEEGRVEMHLVSQTEQRVAVNGTTVYFEEGESIHTENSYKYALDEFRELVSDWFSVERVWTDAQNYFSLQFLSKREP